MKTIALLEPYYTGSHIAWAEGYAKYSSHAVRIYSMPGKYWKWRMHGSAYTLAEQVRQAGEMPDLFLATDMLDVAAFRGLLPPAFHKVPLVLYLHENQLTYPWSPEDADVSGRQDRHYAFLNYRSMLAADEVWFNSSYHREAFLSALPPFLKAFPDNRGLETVALIEAHSQVMPLGVDLTPLAKEPMYPSIGTPPIILWNHRWEYDKGPEAFFGLLMKLAEENIRFRLTVLGESFRRVPPIFTQAREALSERIVHWGYAKDRADYIRLLRKADVLPVTATHDFFGISTVEAITAGVYPLLPNRLAYPEHIPHQEQARHLYQEEAELAEKLRAYLQSPTHSSPQLPEHVRQYDWSVIAPAYDRAFSRGIARKFS